MKTSRFKKGDLVLYVRRLRMPSQFTFPGYLEVGKVVRETETGWLVDFEVAGEWDVFSVEPVF